MTSNRITLGVALVLLVTPVRFLRSQEIDWERFDPKRASPQEIQRVIDFLDGNADRLAKTAGDQREIRSVVIRGNKITTIVYNYGNIARPNLTPSNTLDLVWNRLGYGFEFSPLVAGEVEDANGQIVHILNDGMWLPGQGGYSPDGTLKWGWLPKPGYAAPGQQDIATWSDRGKVGGDLSRRPPSWPESWFNPILGRYVWPAFLGDDATSPDEEVYFVTDDATNQKYEYYPFPEDSTKRGLGLDLECRFFQFNNPLAEDIIFLVYRVTNRSSKTINKVYFGMHGDPHVGGDADYGDDRAFFIPPRGELADPFPQRARSMVYAYDDDGTGMGALPAGYFGFKFLESPSNSTDLIDNDDDGIVDESPFNDAGTFIDGVTTPVTTGIADTAKYSRLYGSPRPRWSGDENGNWDPTTNDVGIDGLPGTNDFGEGNGQPDVGRDAQGNITAEPNFGIRDVNESDQIGLTSFWALPYTNSLPNVPKNDLLYWQLLSSDSIDINQELLNNEGDNVFVYGSGPFTLEPGATQRFSVALLMGADKNDLVLNSETAQKILESNYRFAAPPPKPNVTAVPGPGRVTLYWDDVAEKSRDPLTGLNDFEGYKIYRSLDPTFADVFSITDANGNPFLGRPFQQNGENAQFDLVNEWSGFHPVEYEGRGVKYQLGSNSGLVHQYVDSSVSDGVTYYYAVVSYDHGSTLLDAQFPPSESQASIKKDPTTGVLSFDVNTLEITPGDLPAGIIPPTAGVDNLAARTRGVSTGAVYIDILNPPLVPDGSTYQVDFDSAAATGLLYSVTSLTFFKERFESRDTTFVPLGRRDLVADSITVTSASSGAVVPPSQYVVNYEKGLIRGAAPGSLPAGQLFDISYRYFAVFNSSRVQSEDDNPVFEGMRVFVQDVVLGLDSLRSDWETGTNSTLEDRVQRPQAFTADRFKPAPLDIRFIWGSTDTLANGKWAEPSDTLLNNNGRPVVLCPFRVEDATEGLSLRVLINGASDSIWRPGREIVVVTPPSYAPQSPIPVMAGLQWTFPSTGDWIYPARNESYLLRTSKPFRDGDEYRFTTTAAKYEVAVASADMSAIYVVPNPYVAYSSLEEPGGSSTLRGEQRLQFRNLPPQCTIRIYTMTGELVDTIHKDDATNYASWQILSYEGQRLAYGVYIYHVEVPGGGEKIGRFALIK